MFLISCMLYYVLCFFFFKQKTAYEVRISDWSSDVCSSDLVGVSLGGNAMLKHLGEQANEVSWLRACAAVSVPLDLVACGMRLSDSQLGKQLYSRYFLKTMKIKMQEKAKRFPGNIDMLRINHVQRLREFDDLYIEPIHGDKNALD